MKKMTSGPMETRVAKFLFHYRLTPHAATGRPPAELLFGHRPRSLLDNIKPDISARVRRCQVSQKRCHDAHVKDRKFMVNDAVFVRRFNQGHSPVSWVPGTIEAVQGPLSCLIRLTDNCLIRRHVDHIRPRFSDLSAKACSTDDDFFDIQIPVTETAADSMSHSSSSVHAPRRSGRTRWPPDRWCPPQGGRKCSDVTC